MTKLSSTLRSIFLRVELSLDGRGRIARRCLGTITTRQKVNVEHFTERLRNHATSKKFSTSSAFQEKLARTDFQIFCNCRDLGYFGWNPRGKYRKISISDASDITSMISVGTLPDRIIDLKTIPMPVILKKPLRPQSYTNKFPHDNHILHRCM